MTEEDEILEMIPVYLTKTLEKELHVFQYPTQPPRCPIKDESIINCCLKPTCKQIKLDFSIDTEARTFDDVKAEKIARNIDGANATKSLDATFRSGVADKQSFYSKVTAINSSKYMAGIYYNKEFHVTPLTAIVKMAPSFLHYDKADNRKKQESKTIDEAEEDPLMPVTVKFSNQNTPKVIRKTWYEEYEATCATEPWCEAFWHPCSSKKAEAERLKMFSAKNRLSDAFQMEPNSYYAKLLPDEGFLEGIDALLPPRVLSKIRMKGWTLRDQLTQILKDGKLMRIEEIMTAVRACHNFTATRQMVLEELKEVGLLIHGNWTAQSEVLYPIDGVSKETGVPGRLMSRARNYILYKLSCNPYIYRRHMIAVSHIPPDETKQVLESVAYMNSQKQWVLLLPPDLKFQELHPDLVKYQEQKWQETENIYLEMDLDKPGKRARKRSARDTKYQEQHVPIDIKSIKLPIDE